MSSAWRAESRPSLPVALRQAPHALAQNRTCVLYSSDPWSPGLLWCRRDSGRPASSAPSASSA